MAKRKYIYRTFRKQSEMKAFLNKAAKSNWHYKVRFINKADVVKSFSVNKNNVKKVKAKFNEFNKLNNSNKAIKLGLLEYIRFRLMQLTRASLVEMIFSTSHGLKFINKIYYPDKFRNKNIEIILNLVRQLKDNYLIKNLILLHFNAKPI